LSVYCQTCLSEAQEEALWVAGQLNKNGIKLEYPVAIDVEDSGARKNGYLPGNKASSCASLKFIACVTKYTPTFIPKDFASLKL